MVVGNVVVVVVVEIDDVLTSSITSLLLLLLLVFGRATIKRITPLALCKILMASSCERSLVNR